MSSVDELTFLALKKNLKKDFSGLRPIRIALLGDSSTQFLAQSIRGYGYEVALNFDIYEADYNQIDQEILTGTSHLYTFGPDYTVIVHSSQKLLKHFYEYPEASKKQFAWDYLQHLNTLFSTLTDQLKTQIVYSNFAELHDYVFGNYGNKVESSSLFQIRKLNYELMILSMKYKNVFINDINRLSSEVGFDQVFDAKLYVNSDVVFSLDFTAKIAKNIVDVILPGIGRLKKCLILDLDNTLWGGIIGDDGLENIQLGDLGIGKAFNNLQSWIKQLKNRGVILAVCSKNTEHLAKEPFTNHPDMVLTLDDISVFIANWESKVDNIKYIQSILNIGFDSMVFVDDNSFERELVKSQIPDIVVPVLPEDPSEYVSYLQRLNLFETSTFSKEDLSRTQQYQQEAKRVILRNSVESEEEFLSGLQMISQVKAFDPFNTPRLAQLTQRSNQFNLRTVRYSEKEIIDISSSNNYYTLSFTLNDKFGDHGLIAAIILKVINTDLFIENWVMSCRVLKRGMEQFIVNEIMKLAAKNGFGQIIGQYIATPKNGIVQNLYRDLGFVNEGEHWFRPVKDFKKLKTYINANNENL